MIILIIIIQSLKKSNKTIINNTNDFNWMSSFIRIQRYVYHISMNMKQKKIQICNKMMKRMKKLILVCKKWQKNKKKNLNQLTKQIFLKKLFYRMQCNIIIKFKQFSQQRTNKKMNRINSSVMRTSKTNLHAEDESSVYVSRMSYNKENQSISSILTDMQGDPNKKPKILKNLLQKIASTKKPPTNPNIMMVESVSEKALVKNDHEHNNETYYSTNNLHQNNQMLEDNVTKLLEQKCKRYEKSIGELYEAKDDYMKQLQRKEREIRSLKEQNEHLKFELNHQNQQYSRLKEGYQQKHEEVTQLGSEISVRIQKQQSEKNLYIKEINNKNIEIHKLREAYSVIKSQNEMLNLFVKQKELQIQELNSKLREVNDQRQKVENYELTINQSKELFQEIQSKVESLTKEAKIKDKIIDEGKFKIQNFINQLSSYQEKFNELEGSLMKMNEDKQKWHSQAEEKTKEAEEWKESYLKISREIERLPQLQIKLKNCINTNKDLEMRIEDLLHSNEKLKLQMNHQGSKERKLIELENNCQNLVRTLKEKDQEIYALKEQIKILKEKVEFNNREGERYQELEKEFEEKVNEVKCLDRKLDEKGIILINQQRELKRLKDENDKFKDRNEKIDQIYKQNKRLTNSLMSKINEIEQLQHTLNLLNSKIATISNQNLKLNALYQQSVNTIDELVTSLDTLKMKYESQVSAKYKLEQRIQKQLSQINILTKNLNKEKELSRSLNNEKEAIRKQLEGLLSRHKQERSRFQLDKSELEMVINELKKHGNDYESQIQDLKRMTMSQEQMINEERENYNNLLTQKQKLEFECQCLQQTNKELTHSVNILEKWKNQYLKFMESINRTSNGMHMVYQQLIQ